MRPGTITILTALTASLLAGCVDLGHLLVGTVGTIITHPVGTILPATRPSAIPTGLATPPPTAAPSPTAPATPRPTPTPESVFPVEAVVTNNGNRLGIAAFAKATVPTFRDGHHHAVFTIGEVTTFRQVALTLDADVPFSSPEFSKAHLLQAQLYVCQPREVDQSPNSSFVLLFGKTLTDADLTVSSSGDRISARVRVDFKGDNGYGVIEANLSGLRFKT